MGRTLSSKLEPADQHSGLGAGVSSLCGWLDEGEVWGSGGLLAGMMEKTP